VTVYFDPDTLRRKGDVVKWWELYDYKVTQTVSGNSFLSIKAQNEYDCAEERIRTLAMSEFSGNMGTGTVIYTSSDVGKWAPVQPASLGQTMWEGACAKK
jgi:hypothetical protein